MQKYFFSLYGADPRCGTDRPGHRVNPVQYFRAMLEPVPLIRVTAVVQENGLIRLKWDGPALEQWNHNPELVKAALQRTGGTARWGFRVALRDRQGGQHHRPGLEVLTSMNSQ